MKKIIIILSGFFFFQAYADEIKDPFYKDLNREIEERHSLSKTSLYSLKSLKLVATLLAPEFESVKELRNQGKIPDTFYNSLAMLELPGNEDHVIVYEGQKIGPNEAIILEISQDRVVLEENGQEIIMEIIK